jgi:chemotaxis protein methyltransferase CheR
VSIGLLVTELVLNALKHAFPAATKAGRVVVAYEVVGADWKLSISDNGIGVPNPTAGRIGQKKAGLGTSIVKALAQQLEAGVDVVSGQTGTTVSITHASFAAAHVPADGLAHPGRVPSRPPWSESVPLHM